MADARLCASVERLLRVWMPGVEVLVEVTPAVRGLPEADALVLDAPHAGEVALDRLRAVRAAGYEGGVVVVVHRSRVADRRETDADDDQAIGGAAGSEERAEWARLSGRACVVDDGAGERLVEQLRRALADAAAVGDAALDAAAAAVAREAAETRRRLAVAAVAAGLQHALNNPLAALLAEAQLLEMEQLPSDQRAAVRRMVELCRRMGTTLRALDVAREAPVVQAGRPGATSAGGAPAGRSPGGGWFGR